MAEHAKSPGTLGRRRGTGTAARGDARRGDGASRTSPEAGGYHAWSRAHLPRHGRSSEAAAMGAEMHLSRLSPRGRLRRRLAGEQADHRHRERHVPYRR